MAANLQMVQVPFHGDVLEATQDGRGVWVPIKRPCEALGINVDGQREKLKGKAWSVTEMISATGPDGKRYEMFALHLDSLPMWLATIDANRVKPALREKLERYQREAAKVLADHFFGRREQPPINTELVREIVGAVVGAVTNLLPAARQISDLITIDDRCGQRWPSATDKQRRRIRDLAVCLYRERHGRWPLKLTGRDNGEIAFEREDLSLIDTAIDFTIEREERRLATPLFDRRNR
jgi:hypothetical protein